MANAGAPMAGGLKPPTYKSPILKGRQFGPGVNPRNGKNAGTLQRKAASTTRAERREAYAQSVRGTRGGKSASPEPA